MRTRSYVTTAQQPQRTAAGACGIECRKKVLAIACPALSKPELQIASEGLRFCHGFLRLANGDVDAACVEVLVAKIT